MLNMVKIEGYSSEELLALRRVNWMRSSSLATCRCARGFGRTPGGVSPKRRNSCCGSRSHRRWRGGRAADSHDIPRSVCPTARVPAYRMAGSRHKLRSSQRQAATCADSEGVRNSESGVLLSLATATTKQQQWLPTTRPNQALAHTRDPFHTPMAYNALCGSSKRPCSRV